MPGVRKRRVGRLYLAGSAVLRALCQAGGRHALDDELSSKPASWDQLFCVITSIIIIMQELDDDASELAADLDSEGAEPLEDLEGGAGSHSDEDSTRDEVPLCSGC